MTSTTQTPPSRVDWVNENFEIKKEVFGDGRKRVVVTRLLTKKQQDRIENLRNQIKSLKNSYSEASYSTSREISQLLRCIKYLTPRPECFYGKEIKKRTWWGGVKKEWESAEQEANRFLREAFESFLKTHFLYERKLQYPLF